MNCYIAAVRRNIETGTEEIFKLKKKKYSHMTWYWFRKRKRERLYKVFRSLNPTLSPRTIAGWQNYVRYRLTMMTSRIDVYCTKQYSRIRLDHYIKRQTVIELLAADLVKRCGSLIVSLMKLKNVHIIWTDECNTSQHCGRCIEKFEEGTKIDC